MRRLGLLDVLYLSLDSLKNQPSLIVPALSVIGFSLYIFSSAFGSFSSISELVETIPDLLGERFSQLLVLCAVIFLIVVCGAAVICGMTKVGIATGESSIGKGIREIESHIFSIIVAFFIAGVISGILIVGGILAVTQMISEPGLVSALFYAFVVLLGFMLGILFLYMLPAIVVDGLDSVTAIGLSIGIVLNHLRESLLLAFVTLISLTAVYLVSNLVSGTIHFAIFLVGSSLVLTILVIAVTVDYVNLK
ncbi:MAG: hypothetical protein HXS52_03055 [Theionarchaea archaeon]|nr:hypothetical protein [Theionarchaea archaeon]MBU7036885.1 hypothetical protein [Theionarchaea archaeon]